MGNNFILFLKIELIADSPFSFEFPLAQGGILGIQGGDIHRISAAGQGLGPGSVPFQPRGAFQFLGNQK